MLVRSDWVHSTPPELIKQVQSSYSEELLVRHFSLRAKLCHAEFLLDILKAGSKGLEHSYVYLAAKYDYSPRYFKALMKEFELHGDFVVKRGVPVKTTNGFKSPTNIYTLAGSMALFGESDFFKSHGPAAELSPLVFMTLFDTWKWRITGCHSKKSTHINILDTYSVLFTKTYSQNYTTSVNLPQSERTIRVHAREADRTPALPQRIQKTENELHARGVMPPSGYRPNVKEIPTMAVRTRNRFINETGMAYKQRLESMAWTGTTQAERQVMLDRFIRRKAEAYGITLKETPPQRIEIEIIGDYGPAPSPAELLAFRQHFLGIKCDDNATRLDAPQGEV